MPPLTKADASEFRPGIEAASIRLHGPTACPHANFQEVYCMPGVGFEAYTVDGHWVVATNVSVVDGAIEVRIPGHKAATHLRYGVIDWPLLTVYNAAGLPLSPFFPMRVH